MQKIFDGDEQNTVQHRNDTNTTVQTQLNWLIFWQFNDGKAHFIFQDLLRLNCRLLTDLLLLWQRN